MNTDTDRRQRPRYEAGRTAKITSIDPMADDGDAVEVTIEDISLNGARLFCAEPRPIGSMCRLVIPGWDDSPQAVSIVVRRCTNDGVGSGYQLGIEIVWPVESLLTLGVGYHQLDHVTSSEVVSCGSSAAITSEPATANDVRPPRCTDQGLADSTVDAPRTHPIDATSAGVISLCGGSTAMELRHVRAVCDGDLSVAGDVIGCDLTVAGKLTVDGAAREGHIQFAGDLSVNTLGGGDKSLTVSHSREVRLRLLDEAIAKADASLRTLRRRIEKLNERPDANLHTVREQVTLLSFDASGLEQTLKSMLAEQTELDSILKDAPVCRIEISKRLHRGVTLMIGDQRYDIDRTIEGPLVIEADYSGISLTAENGQPLDLREQFGAAA